MTIPNIYMLQGMKKNLELAEAFQEGLSANFFRHAMYDVKDALSIILAVCDVEELEGIDRIKKSIQKVNKLIEDVSLYHNRLGFNAKHVLENIISVLETHYKDEVEVSFDTSFSEALVCGNQMHFEQSLLYIFVQVIECIKIDKEWDEKTLKVELTLSQRGMDVLISINIKNWHYEEVVRKQLLNFVNRHSLKMLIHDKEEGTELILISPLAIGVAKMSTLRSNHNIRVESFMKKNSVVN